MLSKRIGKKTLHEVCWKVFLPIFLLSKMLLTLVLFQAWKNGKTLQPMKDLILLWKPKRARRIFVFKRGSLALWSCWAKDLWVAKNLWWVPGRSVVNPFWLGCSTQFARILHPLKNCHNLSPRTAKPHLLNPNTYIKYKPLTKWIFDLTCWTEFCPKFNSLTVYFCPSF